MRWGIRLAFICAALSFAAAPDAGVPSPKAPPASADAGAPSEDEQLVKDLDLLENLDVLNRLDQVDVGE